MAQANSTNMTQQIIFNVTYHIVYICVIVTFVMSMIFATGSDGARAQGKEGLASACHSGQNPHLLIFLEGAMVTQVIQICSARGKSYF